MCIEVNNFSSGLFALEMSAARFLFLAVALFACVPEVVGGDNAKYNVFVTFFECDPMTSDLCAVVKSNSSGYYHSSAMEDDGLLAGWPDELLLIVLGGNIWYADLESNESPHVIDTIDLTKEPGEKCDGRMKTIVKGRVMPIVSSSNLSNGNIVIHRDFKEMFEKKYLVITLKDIKSWESLVVLNKTKVFFTPEIFSFLAVQ
ncbi:hypothetical protein M3Y98_00717300 [Aphelenchoides besseyi]|nr:hypothetical protein M3Y98_00717300 [Aphelenchoides besseyi]